MGNVFYLIATIMLNGDKSVVELMLDKQVGGGKHGPVECDVFVLF
jgi:hypothetical protein